MLTNRASLSHCRNTLTDEPLSSSTAFANGLTNGKGIAITTRRICRQRDSLQLNEKNGVPYWQKQTIWCVPSFTSAAAGRYVQVWLHVKAADLPDTLV
jgi:hypothetical protein